MVADLTLDKAMAKAKARGKLLTPDRRRSSVKLLRQRFGVSERRACAVTGQPRSTQRQVSKPRVNVDAEITEILRTFALANPRQGYRKARRAVLEAGYRVNLKKIHRLWREAGLKVPFRKRKNKRAGHGLPMGAHHPTGPNITWAMDFQFDWNHRRQSPQTTQHHR